jgi:peptidoglycan hydrolase-like protein with peptidoglycan-binding domain
MGGQRSGALRRPLFGALAALVLSACSSDGSEVRSAGADTTTSTVKTAVTSSTVVATTAPSTSTTVAAPPVEVVSSADVRAVQERLAELGYDVGEPDGNFGGRTSYSIMAFQKIEGLSRTGDIEDGLLAALAAASPPGPLAGGPSTRVEIDLNRQVLMLWVGGVRTRILPISSGNGEEYCVDGECDIAVTPPGSFSIGRKAEGLEIAPLGELWWPMYFNGGIAIHGSPSVPPYPASHGCIRIPMYAAPTLYDQVGRGTAVILVGRGPGPEGLAAPPEPPPNPVVSSTLPPETDPPTIPTVPTTVPVEEPPTTTTTPPEATTTTTEVTTPK